MQLYLYIYFPILVRCGHMWPWMVVFMLIPRRWAVTFPTIWSQGSPIALVMGTGPPAASALHHLFAISSNNIRGIEEHCLEIAVPPKLRGEYLHTHVYNIYQMVDMMSFCALHHLFAISSNNIWGIEEHCLKIAARPKTQEGIFRFTFAPYLADKMVNMILICAFDHLFAISSHNIQGIETIKKSRVEKF